MSTITLQTKKVTLDTGTPRIIAFQFKTPFVSPIFLGVLTLNENSGLTSISGAIVPGSDASHGGTCDLEVPSAIFGPLWDFAASNSKPSVTITYNDVGLAVTQVTLSAAQAMMAAASP